MPWLWLIQGFEFSKNLLLIRLRAILGCEVLIGGEAQKPKYANFEVFFFVLESLGFGWRKIYVEQA